MSSPIAKRSHPDSEDDSDYVPPAYQQFSEESEGEGQANEQAVEASPSTVQDTENKRREREALWTSFQASVASSSKPQLKEVNQTKLVRIQKRYLFAGEYTSEIVEVPEDSPDVKKWPIYHGQDTEPGCEQLQTTSLSLPGHINPSSSPKKPGPRKPKKTLGPLPSTSNRKAKKLTTLNKSLMDWKAHTGDSTLQDELDTNRKAGGYLGKVEFLKRVDERKEENLESMQSRKRRKL
ncbi:hypothetical protein Ac2012v2_006945 [Leucoagaricus gongylophorus]